MAPSDFVEVLDEANGHEQHLENVFSSRLKPKLDAIELVRSDLTVENIEVPGVVVIGDQSAGKSSVLESLSGINFPRSENTCTRRPCILRMECDNYLVGEPHAYVSNDADLGTTRIPLEEIGAEIQRLTREVAGPGSNIIADSIHVKVVRKVGPTLTLIDLPGITWVNENQQDIHEVIVGMIQRYIKNEQMVILAVVSAVADFGNSEALKLAKEVDPDQIRTIGVVTKIDTIQKDSDIASKLRADRESDIRLNLGWIAVRCRTPTEVKDGLSADALRAKEKEFFQTHPLLSDLDQCYWGTPTLVGRVVDIQSETVDKWIPEVRTKIHDALFAKLQKLRSTTQVCDDDMSKRIMYNKLVTKLATVLDKCVRGDYGAAYRNDKTTHIPPRMHEFFRAFIEVIEKDTQDFLEPAYTQVVEEQDAENRGCSLPNFLSDPVFRTLFLAEFDRVVPKALDKLVMAIKNYIVNVITKLIADSMNDFPRLVPAVTAQLHETVQEQHQQLDTLLRAILDSERSCVTTLDESGYEKMLEEMNTIVDKGMDSGVPLFGGFVNIVPSQVLGIGPLRAEKPRIFRMQTSLAAYSKLMQRQLLDRVAKLCNLFFVSKVQAKLSELLLSQDKEFISANMTQDVKIIQERKGLQNSVVRLENCLKKLKAL